MIPQNTFLTNDELAEIGSTSECASCGAAMFGSDASCPVCWRGRRYRRSMESLTDPSGPYVVRLASAGNPDYDQNPRASVPGVPRTTVRVATLLAASQACRLYIEHFELGGGNWIGGDVKVGGQVIASVSYNGRVWNVDAGRLRSEWTEATVSQYAPAAPACVASFGCQCAGHARGLPSAGRCNTDEVW